jgi:hypothetical protein
VVGGFAADAARHHGLHLVGLGVVAPGGLLTDSFSSDNEHFQQLGPITNELPILIVVLGLGEYRHVPWTLASGHFLDHNLTF